MSVHDYTLFEQRREEILDVARECFAEKGFNATTMAEVARRARMSVGNLYNYFHGKAAIIESLAEREVKKLADEVGRLGETRPSREERIAHLRQIALDAMDIKRARVTLEIFAEAVHNEQLRQIVARIDNKMRELLAQMYRSYGHETDEARLAARIAVDMAVMDGLAIRVVAQNHIDRMRVAEEIAQRVIGRWEDKDRVNT